MEFNLTKEELLRPLQQVIGVVDKKLLQPILSFVLLTFNDNELIISATDLDIELCAKAAISPQNTMGNLLLPAKKLFDICKLLPDHSTIRFFINENDSTKLILSANRSRFTLAVLDPKDFPMRSQEQQNSFSFFMPQQVLKNLLNATAFAIAQQDVRHYLLGMLWEWVSDSFKVVATDGHRLALASSDAVSAGNLSSTAKKIIMPRKSVGELIRLLDDTDTSAFIEISDKSAKITTDSIIFTTKLLDVKFPDYNRVFPSDEGSYTVDINKDDLKQMLNRVSVLSNEKQRAVRLNFSENQMVIAANNPEQEQAEEVLEILYQNQPLEICLNIGYLMDVLNKITAEKIKIQLKQANTPVLIRPVDIGQEQGKILSSYIIMPMSL